MGMNGDAHGTAELAAAMQRLRARRAWKTVYQAVLFCALATILVVMAGVLRGRVEAQTAPDFLQQLDRTDPLPKRLPPFDPTQVKPQDLQPEPAPDISLGA